MNERMTRADGIELATEAFGDPAHPPALLIIGAMASMLWWPDEFCERLVNRARYVIRYDNRDTGHSTIYEPGNRPTRSKTLANDAGRVLDGPRRSDSWLRIRARSRGRRIRSTRRV